MNPAEPSAKAIVWKQGKIDYVGTDDEALSRRRWYSRVRNLAGKTVMPGFVDAHSHFPASGITTITVDLSSPAGANHASLDQLYAVLSNALTGDPNRWLIGFNYDNASLVEGLHPNREALDRVSRTEPIYAYHSSGHMGVANTRALELLGLDPLNFPDGFLQESDAPALSTLVSGVGLRGFYKAFRSARQEYLAQGVTTVNNAAISPGLSRALRALSRVGLLPQRVVANPAANSFPEGSCKRSRKLSGAAKRFYCGGVKLFVDGSPQGFTAYLSEPYHTAPPQTILQFNSTVKAEGAHNQYRGHAFYRREQLTAQVMHFARQGWQLTLHGNGDAAIDLILDAIDDAGIAGEENRPILIHAQTAREDQIARMKTLGVTPSFFVGHVFYWGEWHRERVLGERRAEHLSPTGWARHAGIRYSLHSDAPVTSMRPFEIASHSMLRTTRDGRVLGAEHRLDIEEALRALTIDAAWQHFLDDRLGSLVAGKYADLIVLSGNPLTVSPQALGDLAVLETVVGGRSVFVSEAVPSNETGAQ